MKINLAGADPIGILNSLLNVEQNLHGKAYLEAVARHLWKSLGCKCILFGYAIKPERTKVQTVVTMINGEIAENFIYDLNGTPCQNVFTGSRVCIHPQQVAERFPEDEMLIDMQVQSYVGAPTIVDGNLFGLLAILDGDIIQDTHFFNSLVEFVAARVSIELERYTTQHHLEMLTRQAQRDPLTGLFNRQAFYSTVETVLPEAPVSSLMFVDADDFKQINDSHGHKYGDEVLVFIAKTINHCTRASDVISRFGGEEFVVYLPDIDVHGAQAIAERIHENIRSNHEFAITLSIGLASAESPDSIEQLIENADVAVYEAKRKGKNQTVAHSF